ncbi:unnamed protein product [Ceratitis capitata]|uniref:(Mediterranean fruit fly) hypothetical protein n=1 Tax=Ceratitis capitata TaxID=7213 RepID=A0A811VFB1_CERCA|nr:unnamed protein product [Ceratitis capitata]
MVTVPTVYSKKRTDKTTRRLVLNSVPHERLKDQKHVVHSRLRRSSKLIEFVRGLWITALKSHTATMLSNMASMEPICDWSLFQREEKFTKRILPTERPRRFGQTVVRTVVKPDYGMKFFLAPISI